MLIISNIILFFQVLYKNVPAYLFDPVDPGVNLNPGDHKLQIYTAGNGKEADMMQLYHSSVKSKVWISCHFKQMSYNRSGVQCIHIFGLTLDLNL